MQISGKTRVKNLRDEDRRVEDGRSALTLRSSITPQQILQMSTNSTAAENTLSLLAFSSRARCFSRRTSMRGTWKFELKSDCHALVLKNLQIKNSSWPSNLNFLQLTSECSFYKGAKKSFVLQVAMEVSEYTLSEE